VAVAIIPSSIRSNAVLFLRKDEVVSIVVVAVIVEEDVVATAVAGKAVVGATAIVTTTAEAAFPPTRAGTTPGAVAEDAARTVAVVLARMNAAFMER
jgi:hypothetical protein